MYSRREKTVATLWSQLQKHWVLHVRGTPSSGKSVLAELLQIYVNQTHPDVDVIYMSWLPERILCEQEVNTASPFNDILNAHVPLNSQSNDWLRREKTLVLIDEAQMSYAYPRLWNDFIKRQSGAEWGPAIVLFSSYGLPENTPFESILGTTTPVQFNSDQRISVRPLSCNNQAICLYFTYDEYCDVVHRFCAIKNEHGQPFIPSSDLIKYIWAFSSGHPAGVMGILYGLFDSSVMYNLMSVSILYANLFPSLN